MKSVFLFILSICLLCSCSRNNDEPINEHIGEYIRQTCEENKPCAIHLKDATDFSWDKLYVFNEAVEDKEIGNILGTKYSSTSPYYSTKWFFLKDKQIVRTEEHILYEIDVRLDTGNVLLGEDNPKEKFSVFNQDSIFEVSKHTDSEIKFYYYLRCLTCSQD